MHQLQRDRATTEKALLSGDLVVAHVTAVRVVVLPLW
jgi:hypothetical protein